MQVQVGSFTTDLLALAELLGEAVLLTRAGSVIL